MFDNSQSEAFNPSSRIINPGRSPFSLKLEPSSPPDQLFHQKITDQFLTEHQICLPTQLSGNSSLPAVQMLGESHLPKGLSVPSSNVSASKLEFDFATDNGQTLTPPKSTSTSIEDFIFFPIDSPISPPKTAPSSSCSFASFNISEEIVSVGHQKDLSSTMFEPDLDVAKWSPLFEVAPRVVPEIEHSFAREKRSAIVMEGSEPCDSPPAKRVHSVEEELPPIVVKDPSDRVAVRRARNTEAARRSRAKKNARIDQLEEIVEELREKNSVLEAENRVLRRLHRMGDGL